MQNNKQKLKLDAKQIIDAGLKALNPKDIVKNIDFSKFNFKKYENIYLVGSGKGSSAIASEIIKKLPQIKEGLVIDIKDFTKKPTPRVGFSRLKIMIGTHPLPSEKNILATKQIEKICQNAGKIPPLTRGGKNDLVIAIICGGTSALLVDPVNSLIKTREIYDKMLKSGASINEINTVRRHIDKIKNGGLAELIKPANILSLYVSDVPDSNFSIFGSGPTYPDKTTNLDAQKILKKYSIDGKIEFAKESNYNPKNDINLIIAKNTLALSAMQKKAKTLGYKTIIGKNNYNENISLILNDLIKKSKPSSALIAAGEANVNVAKDHGTGGRNTHMSALALKKIDSNTVFASIASDGHDNAPCSGAIVNKSTLEKIKKENLDLEKYIEKFDTYTLFKKTDDLIITGKLPVNVSDIYLVLRNKS